MGILKQEHYDPEIRETARIFAVLSHPGRMAIITMLQSCNSLTLGQIQEQLGLSQSATSDQVRRLKESGLISGVQVDTSIHYSLDQQLWADMSEKILMFLE